jgi:hypothetical protein
VFVDWSAPRGVLGYIQAVQPVHERLQRILTQAAGHSLLVMGRDKSPALLDAPVVAARDALAAACAGLGEVRVPPAARQHHRHTAAASAAIGHALDRLSACLSPAADDRARHELTRMLRAASDHLKAATRLLPGFGLVDLSQACYAPHAAELAGETSEAA